jgi:hypothetical protein
VSRAELVETTGLSRATVDQLVTDLLDRALVVPAAVGPSTGGRRPTLLSFNRSAGYVLGIDVGATSRRAWVLDLLGPRPGPTEVR